MGIEELGHSGPGAFHLFDNQTPQRAKIPPGADARAVRIHLRFHGIIYHESQLLRPHQKQFKENGKAFLLFTSFNLVKKTQIRLSAIQPPDKSVENQLIKEGLCAGRQLCQLETQPQTNKIMNNGHALN